MAMCNWAHINEGCQGDVHFEIEGGFKSCAACLLDTLRAGNVRREMRFSGRADGLLALIEAAQAAQRMEWAHRLAVAEVIASREYEQGKACKVCHAPIDARYTYCYEHRPPTCPECAIHKVGWNSQNQEWFGICFACRNPQGAAAQR